MWRERVRMRDGIFAALFVLACARPARADGLYDLGQAGFEASSRSGAVTARGTTPTAILHNPAGLAGQARAIEISGGGLARKTCFARVKDRRDDTIDGTTPGGAYPTTCDRSATLLPALAVALPVTRDVALGASWASPVASGAQPHPAGVLGAPSPARYVTLDNDTAFAAASLGVAVKPTPRLAVGLALGWGMARIDASRAAMQTKGEPVEPAIGDVRVRFVGWDAFVPEARLGVLYAVTDALVIGASAAWRDSILARGHVETEANAFSARALAGDRRGVVHGDTSRPDCGQAGSSGCRDGTAALEIPMPIEGRLGARMLGFDRRADLELDMYWTRNPTGDVVFSAPGTAAGLGVYPVPGTAGVLPPSARVPLGGVTSLGAHLGSTVDVAGVLAVSWGASYAAAPQDPAYQTPLLVGGARWGGSVGLEVRLPHGITALGTGAVMVSRSTGGGGLGAATGVPCVRGDLRGTACGDGSPVYGSLDAKNLGTVEHRTTFVGAGVRIAL